MPRKKSGGRNFKKGQSGNPSGRPPLPPEVKAAKALTTAQFIETASRYLQATPAQLRDARESDDTTALDRVVISIIEGAMIFGDERKLTMLLDRTIGKVPDKLESENHHFIENMKRLRDMSDEQLATQAEEAMSVLKFREEG